MGVNVTHSYVVLEISDAAYQEIRSKLEDYGHCFHEDGIIDMHGIAVQAAPVAPAVDALCGKIYCQHYKSKHRGVDGDCIAPGCACSGFQKGSA
jgi:hypothetical protein